MTNNREGVAVICAGCGLELPTGTGGRGRPARFHNGACRQRAHRAQAAHRGSEVLATLYAIETAVSELRRAVLAGDRPPQGVAVRLAQLTSDLAGRRAAPSDSAMAENVTENVTNPAAESPSPTEPSPIREPAELPAEPPSRTTVTENVTKPRRGTPESARLPAPLNLDTVRLERSPDPGVWRVLAGDTDNPTLVGFLVPASSVGRRGKRWIARTAHWTIQVPGGPWLTRKAALVQLVDDYQRNTGA